MSRYHEVVVWESRVIKRFTDVYLTVKCLHCQKETEGCFDETYMSEEINFTQECFECGKELQVEFNYRVSKG